MLSIIGYWPDSITLTGSINVSTSILGQTTYTDPNGIVFINGLKVTFSTGRLPLNTSGAVIM